MKLPATVPATTVPGVVDPSPQSMFAVKEDAVSDPLVSVKLATSAFTRAVASFALVRSIWPFVSIGWLPFCSLLNRDESSKTAFFSRPSIVPRDRKRSLADGHATSMRDDGALCDAARLGLLAAIWAP